MCHCRFKQDTPCLLKFLQIKIHCSKKVQEHFEHILVSVGGKPCWILIWTGECFRNEKMGMKMINLERAEFKDTTQIKVKQ